jgi:hypothetical protein
MPRLYLEVKALMAGKLSAHARLPDITEYAAVFNLDPRAGRSKSKRIRKRAQVVSLNITVACRELRDFQQNLRQPLRHVDHDIMAARNFVSSP